MSECETGSKRLDFSFSLVAEFLMLITTKLVISSLLWRLRADKCQSFSNRGLDCEQNRVFRFLVLNAGLVRHSIFLRFLERAF
jgi:hypothetical protein